MRFVGLIIAIIVAVIAFFLSVNVFNGGSSEPKVVQTVERDVQTDNIIIASRDISVGDVISSDMLDTQPWPSHLLVDGFITSGNNSKGAIGMVSRSYVKRGQPLRLDALSNPSDPGFLAASLPSGMRIVTISSDAVAGLAGFLNPGDRVDVLATHPLPVDSADEADANKKQTVVETLVEDIKVIAVNQIVTADSGGSDDPTSRIPSNISLEVTLEQAQKLRLAQEVGYVSLAMRGVKDSADQETVVTYEKDLTKSDVFDSISEKQNAAKDSVVTVIRGAEVQEINFNSKGGLK